MLSASLILAICCFKAHILHVTCLSNELFGYQNELMVPCGKVFSAVGLELFGRLAASSGP